MPSDTLLLPTAHEYLAESRVLEQRADELANIDDARCVDCYFKMTQSAWHAARADEITPDLYATASAQYHTGLKHLLCAGKKYGRLDARRGLQLEHQGGVVVVPIIHCGFPWAASEFQTLIPPPQDIPDLLRCRHVRPGCGVPIVFNRCRDSQNPTECRFFPARSSFAATAILRFSEKEAGVPPPALTSGAVLEFHDPLRATTIPTSDGDLPLAGDLTAPLAEIANTTPRTYLAGFLQTGPQASKGQLGFLEPYQSGKIPVVFIHGLFSDPQSWADLVNDLRAIPGFCHRFQIWFFRYPTGQGFLRSAAELRQELQAAAHTFDPEGSDPALQQMVLIGHSMGGLIAKLQVTSSENRIWQRISKLPLQEIQAEETTREKLSLACFFEPVPHVRRVIFIASPHRGSNEASGLIGSAATQLIQDSPEEAKTYRCLIKQNPGVFSPAIQERLPTSIDLLKPDSPLLEVMHEMQVSSQVQLHNIIGVAPLASIREPSDGIVPAKSAWHPCCVSVKTIAAQHSTVHRTPETVTEVNRILDEHLGQDEVPIAQSLR